MATQVADLNTLLGVPQRRAQSPLALAHSVEDGLPVAALERVARTVAPGDPGFKFRIVPKATLERRRKAKARLTSEEGNRVARLAKVYAMAASLYRDDAKVRDFLSRPHMMLEGKTPLDVALATGPGADAVVNLLGGTAYGGSV